MTRKRPARHRRHRPPQTWRSWSRQCFRDTLKANGQRILLWLMALLSVVAYNCSRPAGAPRRPLPVPDLVWPDAEAPKPLSPP